MPEKERLLETFLTLKNCCYLMWSWELDNELQVKKTDCPDADLYQKLFQLQECRDAVKEHMKVSRMPMICSAGTMLSWILAFEDEDGEKEKGANKIIVIGPFFSGYKDEENCRVIFQMLKLDDEEQRRMERTMRRIPMVTSSSMMQDALMLHYCVRQEKIKIKNIKMCNIRLPHKKLRGQVRTDQFDDSSGYWKVEQILLDKVRNGDMSVSSFADRVSLIAPDQYKSYSNNPEKYKLSLNVLLTLISRAAVEGGLSRKTAFSLVTDYREKISNCKNINELHALSLNIMTDYTQRVHRAKETLHCSTKIRLCCEYIDTHPDEKITLQMLADKSGYAVSHLSRKFKAEVGCRVMDYIQKSKVEYARTLLETSEEEIEKISGELGFESSSYFSRMFRKWTGESPTDYRAKHRII